MSKSANVTVLGTSNTHRTVVGSRAEVRRWVSSSGASLGAPRFALVGCVGGVAEYDTSRQMGNDLVDVDGANVGLVMPADTSGQWTATLALRMLAA